MKREEFGRLDGDEKKVNGMGEEERRRRKRFLQARERKG
jgi:hypothetical protein